MSSVVRSLSLHGNSGIVVDVECHISNGLPALIIVGFANRAVDESRERLRGAFASSKLELPRQRIIINLAPADVPKDSPAFDLAIAAAILISSGQVQALEARAMVLGELGLDGSIKPVRGIIGALLAARQKGFQLFYIPAANYRQALLIPGLTLVPVCTLKELYFDLSKLGPLKRSQTGGSNSSISPGVHDYEVDFSHIIGQQQAKRALEIAAAGGHNVLLSGPPGTGKSMLAKALPSILPPLGAEEILDITHLHSLASQQYEELITVRPFRAPHHSASSLSILGGGQHPKPGEISLSHRGVLFFDEFPEFNRATIEALRQPLEDGVITVARAKESITFPADFVLIATANPCPCGYYGTTKECRCLPFEIQKYRNKLSGPIIDRIDLYVDVDDVKHTQLLSEGQEEASEQIRARVIAARKRQQHRNKPGSKIRNGLKTNARLTNQDIKSSARLSKSAEQLLNQAAQRLNISARAYMRVIKVARTIADLDGSGTIEPPHLTEALQYRRRDQV